MGKGIFQRVSGHKGEIRVESLGVLVGTLSSWTLVRRGDGGPREDLFDLHAVFSYVNPGLWDDADYQKTVFVTLGKETFTVEQEDGFASSIADRRTLHMQGVRLCQ